METSHPTLSDAKDFAEGIFLLFIFMINFKGVRKDFPDKMFAYNCSPSFNWRKHLRESDMEVFFSRIFKINNLEISKRIGRNGFQISIYNISGLSRKQL